MSITQAIKLGFKQVVQHKRLVLLLYLLTLLLGMLVAYPLKSFLASTLNHSLMVGDMVKGFDYTILNDFMNAYGAGISPILNQSLLIIGVFLVGIVFLMGGILYSFNPSVNKELLAAVSEKTTSQSNAFWGNCAHFFWRLFRLSVYFLFLHGLVLSAFVFLFLSITKGISPREVADDTIIVNTFKYLCPLYLLVAAFFFMWQDYAKIHLVNHQQKWVLKSMGASLFFVLKNGFKTYGLYLVNILFLGLLVLVNYWLSNAFTINTGWHIFFSFLLSQIFIVGRFALKLLNLSSAGFIYRAIKK